MTEREGDYTTDVKAPNAPDEGRSMTALYIDGTNGLWVRKNYAKDEIEIWYDGDLYSSWRGADMVEQRLTTMLRVAVEIGEAKAKRDIRNLLGIVR